MKTIKHYWKQGVYKSLGWFIAYIGQGFMRLILMTCRWEVKGFDNFRHIASTKKCIIALWHNRLAIAPIILVKLAPELIYTALISKSRDGELISRVVNSYKQGRTIRVSHNNRQQALRDIISHLENREVVIITPDGPRGPLYHVKPGIAWTAVEAAATIIPFNWTATSFWELRTWDKLRLPKPFSTISVSFGDALYFEREDNPHLEDISAIIKDRLTA